MKQIYLRITDTEKGTIYTDEQEISDEGIYDPLFALRGKINKMAEKIIKKIKIDTGMIVQVDEDWTWDAETDKYMYHKDFLIVTGDYVRGLMKETGRTKIRELNTILTEWRAAHRK